MNREDLEELAMRTVSPDNYYDLADSLDSMSDNDLRDVIDCNGDVNLENKLTGE